MSFLCFYTRKLKLTRHEGLEIRTGVAVFQDWLGGGKGSGKNVSLGNFSIRVQNRI